MFYYEVFIIIKKTAIIYKSMLSHRNLLLGVTVYMVHLMVILIWWFCEFVFIRQIKCTHCLHSSVSIHDLHSPCRRTKYLPIYISHKFANFMSAKCSAQTVLCFAIFRNIFQCNSKFTALNTMITRRTIIVTNDHLNQHDSNFLYLL